jgi:hypothetical protein
MIINRIIEYTDTLSSEELGADASAAVGASSAATSL